MKDIPKIFGENVFNKEQMLKYLGDDTYQKYRRAVRNDEKEIIDLDLANKIADGMKRWAISKGATHYTHWFQPMNGMSAEKHDSFIEPIGEGKVVMNFSGKQLIKGETDGSSFPNGGLRSTFEARGYTAWDASSQVFVRNETLYIPTIFMSYYRDTLDKKTPLHLSSTSLKKQTIRFVNLFGHKTNHARVTVGAEQEYFLINKEMFDKRFDLKLTGRTLFGARPPKSQELEDHYYGQIKTKVMQFMQELDMELWKLGIPCKTRHNEVAPCQHELAPIFERVSVACDHNELTMEILKKTAEKFGFVCLLHEKPFAYINGSGKHNNWSVSADKVGNMFDPGNHPESNLMFLLYVTCLMSAVDLHQDILRISVASPGNEHRLGANEAPPAIISMFLGEHISSILESFPNFNTSKKVALTSRNIKFIANFDSDTSDRNRTSPFAFTGNKFEFRMPGSSINLSCVNTMLNTAFADVLMNVCDELDNNHSETNIKKLITTLYKKHKRILFSGNGYSKEWEVEAKKRGLLNLKTVPEALAYYDNKENIELFKRQNVYTEVEVKARKNILLEEYCKVIKIESLVMLDMLNREILPSVFKYQNKLAQTITNKKTIKVSSTNEISLLKEINELTNKVEASRKYLLDALKIVRNISDWLKKATLYRERVFKAMEQIRNYCDQLERLVAKKYWPFPTYADILFF